MKSEMMKELKANMNMFNGTAIDADTALEIMAKHSESEVSEKNTGDLFASIFGANWEADIEEKNNKAAQDNWNKRVLTARSQRGLDLSPDVKMAIEQLESRMAEVVAEIAKWEKKSYKATDKSVAVLDDCGFAIKFNAQYINNKRKNDNLSGLKAELDGLNIWIAIAKNER